MNPSSFAEEQRETGSDAGAMLERVRTFSNGARTIFENAEALYDEAQILGQGKSFARSAALHQISMEECAKIDMLGYPATSANRG
jgi:AbiV